MFFLREVEDKDRDTEEDGREEEANCTSYNVKRP